MIFLSFVLLPWMASVSANLGPVVATAPFRKQLIPTTTMIQSVPKLPQAKDSSTASNSNLRRELLEDIFLKCQLEPEFINYQITQLGDAASSSRDDFFQVTVPAVAPDGNRGAVPIDLSQLSLFEMLSRVDDGEISFENQTIGRDGTYTDEIKDQVNLLYDFWQLETSNIGDRKVHVVGLHSEDLEGNVASAVDFYLDYFVRAGSLRSYGSTAGASQDAQREIEDLPGGYSNGALTLIAFVFVPLLLEGPYAQDFVLGIGDGVLDFYEHLGNAEVGPDFLIAHEMAHIVQVSLDAEDANDNLEKVVLNILQNPYGPAEELEADAMATYSLIVAQNYTVESLVNVAEAAASVGDRFFGLPSHHGTPEQRSCAVRWAADEALNVGMMSAREFRAQFQENYSRILQLDPSVCAFVGTPEQLVQVACGVSSSIRSTVSISLLVALISTLGALL